jgi:hypothetical protein
VKEKIIQRRTESFYHDREAKVLPDLDIGEPVYVELKSPDDKYTKSVIDQQVKSRSFNVSVNDRTYR